MNQPYPDYTAKTGGNGIVSQCASSLPITEDFRQRRRITVVIMAAFVYLVCAAILVYGAGVGIFDKAGARALALACVAVATVFLVLMRSGLNLRFNKPSLALPQALCAQTLIGLAYATCGAVHPATLILLATVMVFGMFEMDTASVCRLLAYTISLMGIVMIWGGLTRPEIYPARLQLMYFVLVATVLPSISSLSVQLRSMGKRLRDQKYELEIALARIQKIATCDELTGLPNRRHILSILAEHVIRQDRGGAEFMVAIVDLDHFKAVNDTFGHRVGDEALLCFARQARVHLRSADIVGRWGGEEFLMVLPISSPGDPATGIERLRSSLGVTEVSSQATRLRISFSAGLTRFLSGESIDDVIERADCALYAAKTAGRGRTIAI